MHADRPEMRGNLHDVMCFFLGRVFHDNDSKRGLTIRQVAMIFDGVQNAREHVQQIVDTFQGTAAEHEYVAQCANAMTFCPPCDKVAAIVHKFRIYRNHYEKCMFFNEDVVNLLSLQITRKTKLPFWYVQRRIWAMNFPQVTYNVSVYAEYYVENSEANRIIDCEMERENRMQPPPVHPMLSADEIRLLQIYVQQTQNICKHLPYDISNKVCKRIDGDYTVSPHVRLKSIVSALDSSKACLQAPQLVYIAHVCGNVSIDDTSAFWMCGKLSMRFRHWDLDFIDDDIFGHLALFPEVDPELRMKITAVITHPSWASAVSCFDE